MKKLFLLVVFLISVSNFSIAQTKIPEMTGVWKLELKPSGLKRPPPPDYFLLTDDSIYVQHVDTVGNSLTGASSGRWSIISENILLLYPSDKVAERRYYQFAGENRFHFIGTTLKKSPPMLEMDIFLEKIIRKEGQ